jgi:hypothetical protein
MLGASFQSVYCGRRYVELDLHYYKMLNFRLAPSQRYRGSRFLRQKTTWPRPEWRFDRRWRLLQPCRVPAYEISSNTRPWLNQRCCTWRPYVHLVGVVTSSKAMCATLLVPCVTTGALYTRLKVQVNGPVKKAFNIDNKIQWHR